MNIDFVVPFVDCSDPVWQEQHKPYENVNEGNKNEWNSNYRYRSMNTLKYLFRGVEENMPWIRNIYLILSGPSQIPEWLDTSNPKLKIVYHKDYIPERFLPCFNANTIECFLWRIDGLSEHFIYANDDMVLLKPTSEFDFFPKGNGKTRKVACNVYYEDRKDNSVCWKNMWQNCMKFGRLKKRIPATDSTFIRTDHGLSPLRKSSMKKLFNFWGDELLNTFTNVRDPKNVTQYMFLAYEDDIGNLCNTDLKCIADIKIKDEYIDTNVLNYLKMFDVCCVYDNYSDDFEKKIRLISDFFDTVYPFKSSFEKKDEQKEKVSIIVKTNGLNVKSFIEDIKNQTYCNFECIFIDDCHSDFSDDKLEFLFDSDKRFKVFYFDGKSFSDIIKFGVEHSSGDYVCVFDINDINYPRRIECCVEYLNCHPDMNVCQTFAKKDVIDENSDLYCNMNYNYSIDSVFEKYCNPTFASMVFRKDFLNDIEFNQFEFWEDDLFVFNVISKERILPTLNYIGCIHKENNNNPTQNEFTKDVQLTYIRCISDMLLSYNDSDVSLKRLVRRLIMKKLSGLKFSKELLKEIKLLLLATKFYINDGKSVWV